MVATSPRTVPVPTAVRQEHTHVDVGPVGEGSLLVDQPTPPGGVLRVKRGPDGMYAIGHRLGWVGYELGEGLLGARGGSKDSPPQGLQVEPNWLNLVLQGPGSEATPPVVACLKMKTKTGGSGSASLTPLRWWPQNSCRIWVRNCRAVPTPHLKLPSAEPPPAIGP